jgi:murein DD-endopeptidase MepM/ murein hydrolase activator NlpD
VVSGELDVLLSSPQVGRGETLLLSAPAPDGAASAAVGFGGGSYPLAIEDGRIWGVLGAPLDAEPGPATLTVVARAALGAELGRADVPYEVVMVDRPVDYLTLTPDQAAILTPEAGELERMLRTEQFASFDDGRRWDAALAVPVVGRQTTRFGQGRSYNGGPVGNFHSGEDIAAPEGTPITAPAAGRVSWVGAMPIRGNSVIVDHGQGVKTGYHHLLEIAVDPGQSLEPGAVVGALGATGLATGPHLHWELTIWGVNVDPMTWTRQAFVPPLS